VGGVLVAALTIVLGPSAEGVICGAGVPPVLCTALASRAGVEVVSVDSASGLLNVCGGLVIAFGAAAGVVVGAADVSSCALTLAGGEEEVGAGIVVEVRGVTV